MSTYYNVHDQLRYFVQCHVILGANNNLSFKVIDKFFLVILFLGSL